MIDIIFIGLGGIIPCFEIIGMGGINPPLMCLWDLIVPFFLEAVALTRISHKNNKYETQKPYRVWVLTGYSSWRKNDSV